MPAHVPNEVLVQFVVGANPQQQAMARASVGGVMTDTIQSQLMQEVGLGKLERITLNDGMGIEQAIEALQQNPMVSFVEPNYIYRPAATSNDTYYTSGQLWGVYGSDAGGAVGPSGTTNQFGSFAENAWANGITGSSNVVVGIIDEGIQVTHPDLNDNIWVNPHEVPGDGIDNDGNGYIDDIHGWDFVNNDATVYDAGGDQHGTHVAGTIGGEGGNSLGVVGVNWDVTMISLKFLGPDGGTTADAVRALDYLTDLKVRHGMNIVASNNSWGGGGYSRALHDAIIRSAKQDILFVAAAGNSNSNNDSVNSYPSNYDTTVGTSSESAASYDSVIAVASITNSGAKSSFSSYGATRVDIGAPGSGIWSTVPSNSYASYSGTSMATPHVTGAIALLAASQGSSLSAADLKSAILTSATPTPSMAGITATGGRLNVAQAIDSLSSLTLDQDLYALPDTVGLALNYSSGNQNSSVAESIQVAISSTTDATPETVVLTETGANTGRFVGTIGLASGAAVSGDGILQAAHNDQITAFFAGTNQTAQATVDGMAPIIWNLNVSARQTSADVTWTTNEAATSQVIYGTSPANLSSSSSSSVLTTSHLRELTGLVADTTYYFQVLTRDAVGNLTSSEVSSFQTAAANGILFVDDDQGASFESSYYSALDANGYGYDSWDAVDSGRTPTAAELSAYDVVIWNTGSNYTSSTAGLSSGEQTAIAGYLNAGGRIFISGQDVLYNGVTASFRQDYLKVAAFTNDILSNNHSQTGVVGNAISDGMNLSITTPAGYSSLYVDAIAPVAGAEGLFSHGVGSANQPFSAVGYRGEYETGDFGVVFSTFPFEAISTSASNPNNQAEVLRRTIEYLTVAGSGNNLPPSVNAGNDLSVSDGDGTGAESVTVIGSVSDADGSIASIEWSRAGIVIGNSATLQATLPVGVHTLTLTAVDNEGASASDSVVLTVVANQAPTADAGSDVTVQDSDNSGSENVTLQGAGSDDDGSIASYVWTRGGTEVGSGASLSILLDVGSHELVLTVTDNGGLSSSDTVVVNVLPVPSETVLFEDSFEVGVNNNDWNGKWVEDAQNDYFRSTQRATDGVRSAEVDGLATNATLTLANALNLSGYQTAVLTFDWLIERGFDRGEYLILDLSADGGSSWVEISNVVLRGNVDAEDVWWSWTIQIPAAQWPSLSVRFRCLVSHAAEDANIDNVKIIGVPAAGGSGGIFAANDTGNSPGQLTGTKSIRNLDAAAAANTFSSGIVVGRNDDYFQIYIPSSSSVASGQAVSSFGFDWSRQYQLRNLVLNEVNSSAASSADAVFAESGGLESLKWRLQGVIE